MVTNWEETIKMPINEPAPGKRKSQIQVRNSAVDLKKKCFAKTCCSDAFLAKCLTMQNSSFHNLTCLVSV